MLPRSVLSRVAGDDVSAVGRSGCTPARALPSSAGQGPRARAGCYRAPRQGRAHARGDATRRRPARPRSRTPSYRPAARGGRVHAHRPPWPSVSGCPARSRHDRSPRLGRSGRSAPVRSPLDSGKARPDLRSPPHRSAQPSVDSSATTASSSRSSTNNDGVFAEVAGTTTSSRTTPLASVRPRATGPPMTCART